MKMLSEKATCNSHGQDSSYFLGWQEYEKNPYDEIQNPKGIIQMGLAENQLSFDLLESWLAQNPDAAGFKRNGESIFRELALFQDYHGLPTFKNAMTKFMSEIRGNKVSFDSNKLVLTAGATSANETLMFCLADQGDAFLLPTPYYPGFDRDLKWRTGAEIVPIHCSSSNGFRITESALEEAYVDAKSATLDRKELELLLTFIDAKGIHLISDEIYSGTVFNSPSFVSVMELLIEMNYMKTEVWERVHIVYSLSKDLGLPGFRIGAIYSNDEMVVSAATKMSSFGLVSSQTQYLLSCMLSDKKFTKKYISENQKRLKKRHAMIVKGLQNAGINCLESNAGLFCWVDMRHLLSSNTFDAEMDLWKKIVYDVGLNISPGSSCHCTEPGWFRACFANMSEDTLNLAIRRIKVFVESTATNIINQNKIQQQPNSNSKKKAFSKWVFRLSFNDRQRER
ncbi:unnamed protein product [Withania somnifera]